MREQLSRLWSGRPRVRREHQLALNLAGILLLALALWGMAGYPMPTEEMEFRRLERVGLSQPAEKVYLISGAVDRQDVGSMDLPGRWTVGVRDGRAQTVDLYRQNWKYYAAMFPLGDGPSPVPLEATAFWYREGTVYSGLPLLFLQVPEETERAELELDVTCEGQKYHREAEGFDLGNGNWLFGVDRPRGHYPGSWYRDGGYTLRLYRGDGTLLLEQTGTIPEREGSEG